MLFDSNGYNAEYNVFKSWYYADKFRKGSDVDTVIYVVRIKGGVYYRIYEVKAMNQLFLY